MSNISDAFGEFQFDFSNVKKNPSEIASWLHKFKKALDKGEYFTTLEYTADEDFYNQDISNVVINFVANGCNAYQNNLEWITTNKENDAYKLLLEIDGLSLNIEYDDMETGCAFIGDGNYKVEVYGNAIHAGGHFNSEELTEEAFYEHGFGETHDDWLDTVGADEEDDED